jgi:hypothetical protein
LSDYFKTSVYRKTDSSIIVYILFGDSKLKLAMNKQFITLQALKHLNANLIWPRG